ncbi:MAG: AMP-binding protein, partial [bacterium]|nr:AMP-binding protein [bacterium]
TCKPGNPAYVIYTSGTTGRPKGVAVEHRSAVNVVSWFGKECRLGSGVNVLQLSDYTFDASVNQVFGSLLRGAVLHVVDKRLILYMDKLRHYIDTHLAHIVYYVPMVLNRLLCYGPKLKSLHTVISGGERLNDITKDKILEKGYILYNHYGPTETAVDALASRCSPVKVTLGTPVSNARCYILDTGGKPVPVGVAGELYIAGVGVSRGYLNSPHLTAEKFVNLDFLPDERLYRSGDLVRWLPDGNVEFLGRIDQQVKIRGCRIELGEIRTQLLAVGFIKEAVVVEGEFSGGGEYGEDAGEKYLCAYIVSDSAVNPNELKNRLSNRLPSYMLPAYFVQVDRIPLTAVGKLDRKALPEPEAGFVDRYTPPEGELEEELAAVWADVLGRKKEIIGRETNFFELGGHSLKATLLLSRIHESFGVRLPLEKIFSSPTVKALARNIRGTSGEEYSAVEPVEEESYYALSSAQKRLYVLQEMDETATAYNMLTVLVLVGMLDREKLEGCFIKLIRRHESLRTSFEFVKNSPVQRVHRCPAFEIEYHDGSGAVVVPDRRDQPDLLDTVGSFLEVEKIIEDFVRPFDLSAAPLLRAGLIRMEEKRHMLMVDMHHIISDGISVKRFVTEFMIFYAGGEPAPLKLQYKDYAGWQTHLCLRRPEASRKQEEFWKKQFADEIPILHLPTDYRRPKLHDFEGGQKHFQVSREQTRALKNLALEEGATIFMVLLAVSYIFLSRISGQEDIVIGTPTAGRNHADLQDIIGMFVNTLAVRGLPSGRTIVKQFLGDIRKRTLDVFENQDYHFEDLVDRLSVTRDVGRNPLFDVMFSLEHLEIPEIELPQLKLVPYPFERGISLFDLSIVAREKDGRLWFIFEYNTKLFKQETIHRFSGYFKQLLAVLPHSREKRIRHLELMAPEERKQVLFRFNDTWSPWLPWSSCSETRTVRELFEEQAARIPDYIAVVDMAAGGLFNHFTYGQLNRVSDQLTLTMRKKGIKEGDIVGIMGKRSLEMTAGIFGILKAGAAYMPIDPDFPIGRKQFMLSDSCSKVLVTSRDLAEEAEELTERMGKGEIIFTDARSRRFQVPRLIRQGSSSPAYVIYTSGSTGKPKGVIVEHHSVMNRLYWIQQKYRLDDRDVVVQKTPFIFDVSVCELFRYIPGGGRAVLVPETGDKDPEILVRLIEMSNATTIDFVPSILDIFLDHIRNRDIAPGAATLRWVFVGVEIVRPELVRKFNETLYASNGTQLINAYGPTETTVDVTAFNCSLDEQAGTVVPIGTPMGNIQVYILDKYGNVQPIGVVGELCIGGDGVSRGY